MSILDEAKAIIYGDREKTYGKPDKNLKTIAAYWRTHLHARFGVFLDLQPQDICVLMTALKLARLANDMTHHDSLVDAAGYLALHERVTVKEIGNERIRSEDTDIALGPEAAVTR